MKKEQGSALVLTVFITMIIFSFLLVFLALLNDQVQIVGNDYYQVQGFYLAEAGLARAVSQLRKEPNYGNWIWLGQFQSLLPQREYLVNLSSSPSGNVIYLSSWGKLVGNETITKKVSAQVLFFQPAFGYTLLAVQGIDGKITGVGGKVSVGNTVPFPNLVEQDYSFGQAKSWPSDGIFQGGGYLVKNDLIVNKDLSGQGIVFVRGKVSFNSNIRVKGRISFLAIGEISIGSKASLEGVLLYTPKTIQLAGQVDMKGCLMAGEKIILGSDCRISYSSPFQSINWVYSDYAPLP